MLSAGGAHAPIRVQVIIPRVRHRVPRVGNIPCILIYDYFLNPIIGIRCYGCYRTDFTGKFAVTPKRRGVPGVTFPVSVNYPYTSKSFSRGKMTDKILSGLRGYSWGYFRVNRGFPVWPCNETGFYPCDPIPVTVTRAGNP